jgi:deazaflavin-dependent oxidoreductase (nitroreductase family)
VYGAIGDIATTRWFSRAHAAVYRRLRGRGVDRALGCDVVLLETIGRRTGTPHEVPLFAFRDGNRTVVIASRGGNARPPAWYLNLRAHPDAVLRRHDAAYTVRARDAVGQERERLWSIATRAYPGYETYRERTRRAIPVVVLEERAAG